MDIPLIIEKLDNEISKLVDEYGMTPRIESVNEDWVNLMHAYYTDYRGPLDDKAINNIVYEIYHDIVSIRRINERVLSDRMENLNLNRIAVSGANAVRYLNSIVIQGDDDELERIRQYYEQVHGSKGNYVDFTRDGGPKGLSYGQHHGRNLYEHKILDKDMSNKALGIEYPIKKRKRDDEKYISQVKRPALSHEYDFYIEDGFICIIGNSASGKIDDLLIPYTTEDNVIKVKIEYYGLLAQNELLGKAIVKPTYPSPAPTPVLPPAPAPVPKPKRPFVSRRFKAFTSHKKTVIVGKRKHIDKLRSSLNIKRRLQSGGADDIDLVVINNKDKKKAARVLKFDITGLEPELPSKYLPLMYKLYPSRKPQEEKKPRSNEHDNIWSLDDVYGDTWVTFDEHDNIDDFHEFRGNSQYQNPWIFHMLNISDERFGFQTINNHSSSIYYIAVKRQSGWTKFLKSQLQSYNDKILITPQFTDDVSECIGLGKDFLFTFFTHEFSRDSRHANAIIIDFKNHRIIRFEPHGSFSGCYDQPTCDNYLKDAMKKHTILSQYTYISPSDYEKVDGPQTVEVQQQTKYQKVTKRFGSKERVLEAGGFCLAWTMLFHHMYYLNNTRATKEIYDRFFDVDANTLATNIRVFQSFLVKKAKEYYGYRYRKPFK